MDQSRKCVDLEGRLQEGEDGAALFEAVAECLGEEVRRFAMARCGNSRGDLEDISQDVMVAAQRYLGSFRGDASLRTWLYRLVLSACSRNRRGRKNDPGLHQELDETQLRADPANPEMVLLIGERLAALEEAMAELREEDRELLAYTEWQGESLKQVAERTGLTVPAIKSRLFRIRQQLRARLEERFGHAQGGEGAAGSP